MVIMFLNHEALRLQYAVWARIKHESSETKGARQ